MGKQKTGGYDLITPGNDSRGQSDIDRWKLELDQQEARKKRQEQLDAHLAKYARDPVSQALGAAEFEMQERDAAKAREKAEYDQAVQDARDQFPDDPYAQANHVAMNYVRQRTAPGAQQAFAEGERLAQMKERDKTARKLENIPGVGRFAITREMTGAAIETVPRMASILARLSDAATGEKAADEANRQAQRFGEAREQAREEDVSPYLSRQFGGAAQSFIQMMGTPGGAYSKIAGTGAMAGNEALTTAEDAGLKGAAKLRYAGTQGLLEAGIAAISQKLFGPGIESRLAGQSVAARTFKELAKNFGKDVAKEIPEETLTTVLQDLSSKYEGVSPDMTPGDFVNNAVDTVVQTIMMGGMGQALDAGRNKLSNMVRSRAKEPTPPPMNPEQQALQAQAALTRHPDLQDLYDTANPITKVAIEQEALRREQARVSPEQAAGSANAGQSQLADIVGRIPPVLADFMKTPSSRNYDAAVKAGMPALGSTNRSTRSGFAKGLKDQAEGKADPTGLQNLITQMTQSPVSAGSQPVNVATLGSAPEVVSGEDEQMRIRLRDLLEGSNDEEGVQEGGTQGSSQGSSQGIEGQGQGQQERLLVNPEGTQETAAQPAVTQESQSAPPISQFTPATFEQAYRAAHDAMFKNPADTEPVARLAELYDLHPDWADAIDNGEPLPQESTTSPGVPAGQTSPEQSAPSQAVPVSPSEPESITYHSGLSRSPAEMDAAIKGKQPVGVSAFQSLTQPVRKRLVKYANEGGKVFVDSGAFTAFMKGREVNWDDVLFSYRELIGAVKPENRDNITIVAPDVVGDHQATMDLHFDLRDTFEELMGEGSSVIFPVQKEEGKTLAAGYADLTNVFGDSMDHAIVGVPYNAKAWSQDDVLEFMRTRDMMAKQFGETPRRFHLLGGGETKIKALLEAAQDEWLTLEGISGDAMPKSISARRRGDKKPAAESQAIDESQKLTEEPPKKTGHVRVYHSGSAGDGKGGRWVSTSKEYGSGYRPDSPLFFTDIPEADPRVNNPDYADQGVKQGFAFNFELTPEEAKQLREIPRESPGPSQFTPAFKKLPAKSQKLFNDAWDANNADAFKNMLYRENKGLRGEFEARTGVQLPKSKKGTDEAIDRYFAEQTEKPTPVAEKKPKKTGAAEGRSLRSQVIAQGGIASKALQKDYNIDELRQNGLLTIMRADGLPIDMMAQTLETSGYLRTPEGRNPSDWLMEQLVANADVANAEYTDKEIEKQLRKEYEAHEALKQLGLDEAGIEELRGRSEEAGIRAADEGEPDEGPITDEELEVIDTSFDFGANVKAEEEFKLEQPKKPKPSSTFEDNDATKQGSLFDAGKNDLEGQQLLFNTDPGDMNNPRTQENKPSTPTQPAAAEASQEDLMKAILREELLGEKPPEAAPPAQSQKPRPERKPDAELRKGKVGDKLAAGEVVLTVSGRKTTPFPKFDVSTERKAQAALRAANQWLRYNAVQEAIARKDDFNGKQFAAEDPKNIPQASKDAMEEYLFGTQPDVIPSILKPIVPELPTEGVTRAASEPQDRKASLTLVDALTDELKKTNGISAKRLWELADAAFGGTRAEGKYGPSEAYDALETAINMTIIDKREMGLKVPIAQVPAEQVLQNLLKLQSNIASQTNRSGTKDSMQQFSTPPAYSYVVSQFANINAQDVVVEPSGGTGDLAVHALNQRARVHVNELDPKRAEMLTALQDVAGERLTITNEDALQLNNIMGETLRPSVVLMNPPFSREGQRMGDKKIAGNDRNHIESALSMLVDGGRLIAIIGAGLHGPSKGFTAWLDETAKKHNVRANIEVNRDVYKGYGTTFPTRVLVIDKGTPTPKDGTFTATAESLEQLLEMTKEIRNGHNRPTVQPIAPRGNGLGLIGMDGPRDAGTNGAPANAPDSSGREDRTDTAGTPKTESTVSGDDSGDAGNGGGTDSERVPATGKRGKSGRGSGSTGGRTKRGAGKPSTSAATNAPESRPVVDAKEAAIDAELNAALQNVADLFGGRMLNTGYNPEQMRALARLVKAAFAKKIHQFSKFVEYVHDNLGEPMARQIAKGLELAWGAVKQLPEFKDVVGDAGDANAELDAIKEKREPKKRTEIDESVLFEPYRPSIVPFKNAQPHPTSAVESAAMAAVTYPKVTEVPNIGKDIIESGRLSDIQLEFIALATHAHGQTLPNEERTGVLFGDGTGMGKGRGIPGVILHNWNEGRKMHVWMSKNQKLYTDAMAEWSELGGAPSDVRNLGEFAVDDPIDMKEGILFTTYDTLSNKGKSGKTRIQQVMEWLPKDFDGVIAFDEAHLMGSDTAARAGTARELQDKFPKARVVYASATSATEINDLTFASRLGLWGAGTPFATAMQFAEKIGAAGVSAMESVALSLKAMGRYVSRSISFNDGTPDGTVGYRRLEHKLEDHQLQMYDRAAIAWQKVIQAFEVAMDHTEADNRSRGHARGQFWSAHQRFFNDLVTSLQMPSVIADIEKDIAEGRSAVIQLTSTGAARMARALAGRQDQNLDDFSADPFESLVELVRTQFPTQAFEDYVKPDGSTGKRPVRDSKGNPVKDAEAVQMQQQLLSDLEQMKQALPESPIDMILNHFGVENVAEVTARDKRVVFEEQPDGTVKKVVQRRSKEHSTQADIDAFQEGKKRILIFSQAGGTGASYHADRRVRNQQKRVHYLVQAGWIASAAIQGLGRTHRTNQRQTPEFVLVQTDIPGQKRFISTIARRLTQLGALTRGQRSAGGGGVFDATDNLESREAELALREFFKSLERGDDSEMTIDEFEEQTGLVLRLPSTGAMKSDNNLPDITQFMNRLLSMTVASQNKVFDKFDSYLKDITEARRASGQLDEGVETLKGENVRKTRDQVVYTHDSGAETRYVQINMDVPIPSRSFDFQSKAEKYTDFIGYFRRKSDGKVFFVNESYAKQTKSGQMIDMVRYVPAFGEPVREERYLLNQRFDEITRDQAGELWDDQYKNRPKTKLQKVDMITGAVLPIWDRLPQTQPKLQRALITETGEVVLGVVIPPTKVNDTLRALGAEKNQGNVEETVNLLKAGKAEVQLTNGWKIARTRVQNEWRLEITGPTAVSEVLFRRYGVIIERIGFTARYFIPMGDTTLDVFNAVTRGAPVQNVNEFQGTASEPEAPKTGLEKAREELRQIEEQNQKHVDTIKRELGNAGTMGSGLGLNRELSDAVSGLLLGQIKKGVKKFEIFLRETLESQFTPEQVHIIKPRAIRTWNAVANDFGLTPATEAEFSPPPAKPKKQKNRQRPPGGETYSTKNAFTDREREQLGMGPRNVGGPGIRENQIAAAREYASTAAGSDYTDKLVKELSEAPRATTVFENDMLLQRKARLKQKRDAVQATERRARESGNEVEAAKAETESLVLLDELKQIIQFLSEGVSYALGSQLQARKAEIDEDLYSVPSLVLDWEAAHGRKMDPNSPEFKEIEAKVKQLEADMESLRKLLSDETAKTEDLQKKLAEAHDTAIAGRSQDEEPQVQESTSERLFREGKEQVQNAFKKIKSITLHSGVPQELYEAFVDLAVGFTKMGVVTLGDFLGRVRKQLGDDADQYRDTAVEAWRSVHPVGSNHVVETIVSKINVNDPDSIGRAARKLHAYVIERDGLDGSAQGRDAAVEAVHEILTEFMPGVEWTIDQTARAMSGIGIYSPLSQDAVEVVRRDQKAQLLLLEQAKHWEAREAPPKTGPERGDQSDEQRRLRRVVNELKRAAGIVEKTEAQLRSALDAAKRSAANRITDLDEAIRTHTPIPGRKTMVDSDNAVLKMLRGLRDELQKEYNATFGRPELTDEQRLARAEKAVERAVEQLENDLASGKLYGRPRPIPLTSPALEAKRAELDALKALREEMRVRSGQAQARSDAQYERVLKEREAEMARRIAEKDYAPAPKKPPRELTPEMLKRMQAIDNLKREFDRDRAEWVYQNQNIVMKALHGARATTATLRKVMTTIDMSLVGRQGILLGATNPAIYAKAIANGMASDIRKSWSIFPTEDDLFRVQAELDADPAMVRMEKIGRVAVTDVHGGIRREEGHQFTPEWVNAIPGIGGSERSGSAFINTLRRLVFRSFAEKLGRRLDGKNKRLSNADLRLLGNLVNVATGRAAVGQWAGTLAEAANVFFSPQWWASRLLLISGQPIWYDLGNKEISGEARIFAAQEWAKQIGVMAAMTGLAVAGLWLTFGAPGDDEEWQYFWNPASPNFGSIRIGHTMIDMTAGLGQHVSYFTRMASGIQANRWETQEVSKSDVFTKYVRGKLAPIPSMIGDYLVGRSMGGHEFGSPEWIARHVSPLIAQDVWDAANRENPELAATVMLMVFFGLNADSREARVKERKDAVNEARAFMKQGKTEEAERAIREHLAKAASDEAKEQLKTATDEQTRDTLEKVMNRTESPELDNAIEREKGDLALMASVSLSAEDRKGKSAEGDNAVISARELLKMFAPTYDDAVKLYDEAYKRRNGSLTEVVGKQGEKRRRTKPNVATAKRRLRLLYSESATK